MYALIYAGFQKVLQVTPARTHSITGLKSRVLKLILLATFHFEI